MLIILWLETCLMMIHTEYDLNERQSLFKTKDTNLSQSAQPEYHF